MNTKLLFVVALACRCRGLLSYGLATPLSPKGHRSSLSRLPATAPNGASAATLDTDALLAESPERLSKLQGALRSFNSSDASDLLNELSNLRESSSNNAAPAVNAFLDALLADIEDANVPFWAKTRFLSRFSKRARLSSLGRTLDLVTPPPSEETIASSNTRELEADLQRRRRRALLSLLRTLSSSTEDFASSNRRIPAIRHIERKARQELRQTNSNADMLQRRPSDLETPNYTVLSSSRRKGIFFEIRSYEPFRVCSVNMAQLAQRDSNPTTDAAVNEPAKGSIKAFGALAGYLFGKNQQQQAMKMTTPVLTTEDKRMSFVLPSAYWNDDDDTNGEVPPQPLADSGVQLERVEGATRAVVMFGGYAVKVAEQKEKLLQQVANDKEWRVAPGATPVLAQYNDPFTPPWKRLNEVSIPVQRRDE